MEPLVRKAHAFAAKAHAGVYRMGSGEPYVEHCERVAASLAALGFPEYVVAAALLHDVVEDCPVSSAELAAEFGSEVAELVAEVTNPVLPKVPGNRAWRMAEINKHLAKASYFGASIKLADIADNASGAAAVGAKFANRYLPELAAKLAVVSHGHAALVAKAKAELGSHAAT